MTADSTLPHVSDLVYSELASYFPNSFVISGVTSELLPGPRR